MQEGRIVFSDISKKTQYPLFIVLVKNWKSENHSPVQRWTLSEECHITVSSSQVSKSIKKETTIEIRKLIFAQQSNVWVVLYTGEL